MINRARRSALRHYANGFYSTAPALLVYQSKVENILKCILDSIPSPSPSEKIQIKGGKVCLRRKGKTLLGILNKRFVFKNLLTTSSNVLPFHLSRP